MHQVDRITIHSVPVLSTSVNVVDMDRDLGELGEFRRLLKTFLFAWDIGA